MSDIRTRWEFPQLLNAQGLKIEIRHTQRKGSPHLSQEAQRRSYSIGKP